MGISIFILHTLVLPVVTNRSKVHKFLNSHSMEYDSNYFRADFKNDVIVQSIYNGARAIHINHIVVCLSKLISAQICSA